MDIILNDTWVKDINLTIKRGNILAIYTDDGPTGMCGQSTYVTSPHTYIFLFNSYDEFKKSYNKIGRSGKRAKIRWVEVGDSGTEGIFSFQDER